MSEPREQERANKQEQPGPAQADPREWERLFAAFRRGVLFRDTTNTPIPDDDSIRAKLELSGIAAVDRAREPDRRLAEALTLLRRIGDDGLPSVHSDREWRVMVESVVSAFLVSGDENDGV